VESLSEYDEEQFVPVDSDKDIDLGAVTDDDEEVEYGGRGFSDDHEDQDWERFTICSE
jgi:hypothetical protein